MFFFMISTNHIEKKINIITHENCRLCFSIFVESEKKQRRVYEKGIIQLLR